MKMWNELNGTCETAIVGYEGTEEPFWTLGSPWFSGKYVDFMPGSGVITVSYLKEGVLPAVDG